MRAGDYVTCEVVCSRFRVNWWMCVRLSPSDFFSSFLEVEHSLVLRVCGGHVTVMWAGLVAVSMMLRPVLMKKLA